MKNLDCKIGWKRDGEDKIIKLSFDRIPFVGDCLTSPQMKSTLASHSAKTRKNVSNFDLIRCKPFNSPLVDDAKSFFITCVIGLSKKGGGLLCLGQASFIRFLPQEWANNLRLAFFAYFAWDQPNRAVRTRMLRGVGGAACEGSLLSRWTRLARVFANNTVNIL